MLGKMYFGSEAPAHPAYREMDSPRSARRRGPGSSVRSATYAAYRAPSCHAGRSPRAAGRPFHVGRSSPGQSALPRPKGWLAHTPHSSHRADSPRVYLAALVLPYHRPRRMIAGPGRTRPATMAREPLPQTRCLRRSIDPTVGRLPEDGRYRIAAELPELAQGGHGPAGDEHRLALARLIGFAPVDEQPAGAVVSPFDVGRNESGDLSAPPLPGGPVPGALGRMLRPGSVRRTPGPRTK